MKKILTYALAASCLLLSSCMKTKEVSPLWAGVSIYGHGQNYYLYSIDPAHIAIRLNALLIASNNAENLSEVSGDIRIPLFGNATFIRSGEENEVVTITYPALYNTSTAQDVQRSGKIIINTGGKFLNEEGSLWEVSTVDNADASTAYCRLLGISTTLQHEWESYTIACSAGELTVEYSDFATTYRGYEDPAAVWDGSFTITPADMTDAGMGGSAIFTKKRTVEGSATGNPIGNATARIDYEIRVPLVYNPVCSWFFLESGTEYVKYPGLKAIDPKTYPAADVTVKTTGEITSCLNTLTIQYNGGSYTYQ